MKKRNSKKSGAPRGQGTDINAPDTPRAEETPNVLPAAGREKGEKRPAARKAGLVPADPLHHYLEMVRRIPRLSPDTEHQLSVRVQKDKDSEAALQLVTSNLWLVVSIALEFRYQFQNMLDLIQEGNIGLMRAIQKFDPFKGVRLPTYATYWIRAYIIKYVLDNWRLVRVGTTNTRRKLLFNLNKVTGEMRAAGIDPAPRLLAEHFNTTEEDVRAVQKTLSSRDVSLETPVAGDSGMTFAEVIGNGAPAHDEALGEEEMMGLLKKQIASFAQTLKDSEKAILHERLMSDEPKTLAEIGEQYGITREAVRQAETRLMKKLKKHLEEKIPGISDFSFVPPKKGKGFWK